MTRFLCLYHDLRHKKNGSSYCMQGVSDVSLQLVQHRIHSSNDQMGKHIDFEQASQKDITQRPQTTAEHAVCYPFNNVSLLAFHHSSTILSLLESSSLSVLYAPNHCCFRYKMPSLPIRIAFEDVIPVKIALVHFSSLAILAFLSPESKQELVEYALQTISCWPASMHASPLQRMVDL